MKYLSYFFLATSLFAENPKDVNLTTSGHSMEPTLYNGYHVHIDKTFPFDKLKSGDIVVFSAPDNPLTVCHRLKDKTHYNVFKTRWWSKGDNRNDYDTTPIELKNYIGKVIYIEKN